MKCDDVRAAYLAGDAGRAERDHLGTCADCADVADSLITARRILDDPAFWEEPVPGLEDRVVAMIAGPADAAAPLDLPRRRALGAALAAAAAAVIVVVALVGLRPAAPDWEVALPGTAEAPAAVGTVAGWNESGGTRVALDITGLEPAPPGYLYEFWFTSGELHISAGTFMAPEDVELWVGVTRAEFPRLWITLEPIDEDESPSGTNVMDTG